MCPRLSAPPFSLAGDGGGGSLGPGSAPSVSARLEDRPERHGLLRRPGPTRRQPAEGSRPDLPAGPKGMAPRP